GRWGSQLNQARALEALGLYRRSCDQLLDVLTSGALSCDGFAADDPDVRTRQQRELLVAIERQPDSRLKAMALRSLGNQLRLLGQLQASEQILLESLDQDDSRFAKSSSFLALGNTHRAKVARSYYLRRFSQEDKQDYEEPWQTFSQHATLALGYYQRAVNLAPSPSLKLQAELNRLELLSDLVRIIPQKVEYLKTQVDFNFVVPLREIYRDYQRQIERSDREQADFRAEAEALVSPIYTQIEALPLSRAKVKSQLKLACQLIDCDRINLKQPPLALSTSGIAPLPLLEDALNNAQVLGKIDLQSQAYGILGKFHEANSQWEQALEATEQAVTLGKEYKDLSYEWQWQKGRILQAQQQQNFSEAQSHEALQSYRQAVSLLKELRQELASLDSNIQYDFRDKIEPVYRQFVGILLQSETNNQDILEEARQAIEDLQIAELDNFFQDACVQEATVEIDTVVDELDPTSALIYTIILDQKIHVISKLPQQPLSYHQVTLDSERQIQNTLFSLSSKLRDVTRLDAFKTDAEILYNWLIEPVEIPLTQSHVETLVFVLDTTLQRIPMSVLYNRSRDRFLIEDYAIATTPGITIIEPKPLDNIPINALTAGLSEERFGFSGLDGVEQEIRTLRQLLGSQTLLNQSFTRRAVEGLVNSSLFSIVHVATHGHFSSNPERTFLLLSDDLLKVRSLDRVFRLSPITRANPIELLVMSACETATGDERAALGLAGMAIRSGARSTLATLWQARDDTTANLMVGFYRRLKAGENKAKALRDAQLDLLSENRDQPRIWAPYTLVGNWL
ncbi:CHAT domain-containing protein, partial [Geitlerinema sp. P-1104]|uniref:CHAT domain-containing protein n=1 Tax=Geitlerinema sp. P-1104 TaxID=2546230 RepID=UPI001476F326